MAFWEIRVTGSAVLPYLRSLRVAVTTASSSSLTVMESVERLTWAVAPRQYNAITAVSRYRLSTIVGVLALSSEVNRVYAIAFSATSTKVR